MIDSSRRTTLLAVVLVAALVSGPAASAHVGPAIHTPTETATHASTEAGLSAPQETTTAVNGTTTVETTTQSTTPDHAVSPRPFPERPDPLNATNADMYVAAYEEVRKHNEILRETTDVSITSIDLRCGPASFTERDDGFEVEVTCGFSYEFGQNGTSTGIADGAPYLARYFVNDSTTDLLGLRSALGVGQALPRPFPEKPDPLNASSVLPYAAAYEEVRKHNEILDDVNSPNATVTETFVSCLPETVEETDGGFLADVSCNFAYFVNQDGSVVMVESLLVPSYTASYRINETATELVAVEQASGPNQTATPAETTTADGEARTAIET